MSDDGTVTCGNFYINKCVCLNSMSFTVNIVNIHRTIVHVLAFKKGETFWFFTSLEHHKMRGKEKKIDGCMRGDEHQLLFEVRLVSVQFD